jgi:hypothetical protein
MPTVFSIFSCAELILGPISYSLIAADSISVSLFVSKSILGSIYFSLFTDD